MKKSQAIQLFGGRRSDLAKATGVTGPAISQWPEELSQRQTDIVMGAALRLGKIPVDLEKFLEQATNTHA